MAISVVVAHLSFSKHVSERSSFLHQLCTLLLSERVSLSHDYTCTVIDGVVMGNGSQVKQFTVR